MIMLLLTVYHQVNCWLYSSASKLYGLGLWKMRAIIRIILSSCSSSSCLLFSSSSTCFCHCSSSYFLCLSSSSFWYFPKEPSAWSRALSSLPLFSVLGFFRGGSAKVLNKHKCYTFIVHLNIVHVDIIKDIVS